MANLSVEVSAVDDFRPPFRVCCGKREQLSNPGSSGHMSEVHLSKPGTILELKGQFLEPRWKDGRAGL